MIATLVVLLAATPTPTPRPLTTPAPISILKDSGSAASASRGQSLGDVAKGIKLKMTPGARVLDNTSVRTLSEGVELTTAQPVTGGPSGGPVPSRHGSDDAKQRFWVGKYQAARARVMHLEAEVKRLEALTKDLERKFYAWDDPAYRDGVIKPSWDKALVDLRNNQEALDASRSGPDDVIEEAQRDGALPGWFRGLPEPTEADLKAVAIPTATPMPFMSNFE